MASISALPTSIPPTPPTKQRQKSEEASFKLIFDEAPSIYTVNSRDSDDHDRLVDINNGIESTASEIGSSIVAIIVRTNNEPGHVTSNKEVKEETDNSNMDTNQNQLNQHNIRNTATATTIDTEDTSEWTCLVCYESKCTRFNWRGITMSCGCNVCASCFKAWCTLKVDDRVVDIHCPLQPCDIVVPECVLLALLDREHWVKYQQYKTDVIHSDYVKTCPTCGVITFKSTENNVVCTKCHTPWCFHCHSPSHPNIECAQFQAPYSKFRRWSKKHASSCPVCQAPIQKAEGCNHMNCRVCNAHYCYGCGVLFVNGDVDPALHKCRSGSWKRRGRTTATTTLAVGALTLGLVVGVPLCIVGGIIVGTGWGVYYSISKPLELIHQLRTDVKRSSRKG